MEQVGHGLSVDVSRGRGQRRVDVGVSIDPNNAQLPDRHGVTVDGADRQTEPEDTKTPLDTWTQLRLSLIILLLKLLLLFL